MGDRSLDSFSYRFLILKAATKAIESLLEREIKGEKRSPIIVLLEKLAP
ncbi:MAG: hypothetical protein AAGD25_29600 [Cyanobacteria bacterium P01_F01_bin.150]